MKKSIRRCLIISLLSLSLLISSESRHFVETSAKEAEDSKAILTRDEVVSVIYDYTEIRQSLYSCNDTKKECNMTFSVSSVVKQDLDNRILDLARFEMLVDCRFVSAKTILNISSVEIDGNKAYITAYEVNFIDYCCNGYNEIDRMGFGTEHTIVISKEPDGKVLIISDSFDESNSTGFHSSDIVVQPEGRYDGEDNSITSLPEGDFTYHGNYSPAAAVNYAHTWCGVTSNSGNATTHIYNWNTQYYYCGTDGCVDCANFVSQCLHESGIPMNYSGYSSGWYMNLNNSGMPQEGAANGSAPWVGVYYFRNYWMQQGIAVAAATNANTFVGNPVYWLNSSSVGSSGHLMICTAKNASGAALVTAHNGDVIDFPMSTYAETHSLYTLFFRCTHSWIPYGTKYKCIHCGSILPYLPS